MLEAPERSHDSRFVGRARELELVREAWRRAQAEQRCELVTIVGEPGIGKSRLVAEAVAEIGARTVRGHCLPYGDGIIYWPVVEVIKQLRALPSHPDAAAAIRSLLGQSDARRLAGRDRLGVPQAARGAGAPRRRLRRRPVGRRDVPRPDRGRGLALVASADPARLPGPCRAPLATRRVAGHSPARAVAGAGGRRADRRRPGCAAGTDRCRGRRQPALPHADARHGRGGRRGRRPSHAARAARRPPRPARGSGALRPRARRGRRGDLPSRRSAGARPRTRRCRPDWRRSSGGS